MCVIHLCIYKPLNCLICLNLDVTSLKIGSSSSSFFFLCWFFKWCTILLLEFWSRMQRVIWVFANFVFLSLYMVLLATRKIQVVCLLGSLNFKVQPFWALCSDLVSSLGYLQTSSVRKCGNFIIKKFFIF